MKTLLIAAASVALLTALPAQAADLAATAASLRDKALADPTAWDVLDSLTGSIASPADWAQEHDHYLYGGPKREDSRTGD